MNAASSSMLIAITGGIGCGKSTVSRLLRVMGYPVYDCDSRARALMESDAPLRRQLREAFGADVYRRDGRLDRPRLAASVFGDAEALRRLNGCVHPAVGRDLRAWADCRRDGVAFYESAILFESGFDQYADLIWSVTAPDALRIARCQTRDKCGREKILARMSEQLPQSEKDRRADAVVINDARHSLIRQVRALLRDVPPPALCRR